MYPSKHGAYAWNGPKVESVDALFQASCRDERKDAKRVLRSSFSNLFPSDVTISPSKNGFVYSIFAAYNSHLHLVLRPEDIWFAILTQFSFHINANAEKLRKHFVAHSDRKEVEAIDYGTIFTVDVGALAVHLTKEMDKHLVDPELRDWIMPNFTTTTKVDAATAAVLMMGSMQAYFKFRMTCECGIPSVKLLGDKEDWIDIRQRLNKLASFGEEPKQFGQSLTPVLDMFVQTFEASTSEKVIDFWNKACFRGHGMSGRTPVTGWVTAFCFWDEYGRLMGRDVPAKLDVDETSSASSAPVQPEEFDMSIYKEINMEKLPNGFASVPVKVNDNGKIIWTRMVAGSVGLQLTSTGEALEQKPEMVLDRETWTLVPKYENQTKKPGLDTVQPLLGWWMYEVNDSESAEAADNM